ncbi:MAG TPA: glycosyltransferase [Pyrinomonadaceae bacterium]
MRVKRVLVCAPLIPEFDREGGSRRIFHLLEFFKDDGWAVSFMAQNAMTGMRYAQTLQQMGIPTYVTHNPWPGGESSLINPVQLIATGHFDIILLAFWHHAETYLSVIRAQSPHTRVVIDSIDLHFLRQARSVFCQTREDGSTHALDAQYAHEMVRELNAYSAADAVLTVSEKEAGLVNDFTADSSLAYAVPDTEDLALSDVPRDERKGILFVGNYRHPPNVQAVEYLCKSVLPLVPEDVLAAHPVYIIGNGLNETVIGYGRDLPNVLMVGWVPSVLPYLQRARMSVIPLLYGAGTKRKLMQSVMVGTPSVSTSIGTEGLNLEDGSDVLVADDPARFADSITQLVRDDALWEKLVLHGRSKIMAIHGRESVKARFNAVISEIMKKPVKRHGAVAV